MRRRAVLSLVGSVPLAGCSLFDGRGGGGGVRTDAPSRATGAATPTRTPTPDGSTPATERRDGTSESAGSYPLADVVLRLSDLASGYEQNGESDVTRESADDETGARFAESGIARQFSRTFVNTAGGDRAALVLSEATVFDAASDAAERRRVLVESLTDGGGSVETAALSSDVRVRRVRYTSDSGARNVVLYHRTDDLLLTAVASDEGAYHEAQAESLAVTMIADA